MKISPIIISIIILVLVAGNIFFAARYIKMQEELRQANAAVSTQNINENIFVFTQLFIEKVLNAETEVDFETRLQLENAVRAIGDEQIAAQWKRFTESATEIQAQDEVKKLLSLLVLRIGR
jgi:hypothetical protein